MFAQWLRRNVAYLQSKDDPMAQALLREWEQMKQVDPIEYQPFEKEKDD